MKSNPNLLLLMAIFVASGDNPSPADLTDKDDDGVHCDEINVDADDVSYEVVDREENTIALNWADAFKADNVDGFTVAGCVYQVVVDYGCENMETCCNGGGGKIKSSLAIYPKVDKEEPVIISACGEQKFICVRFKDWIDSKWRNGRGSSRSHSCSWSP